jgi:hypothetical protein
MRDTARKGLHALPGGERAGGDGGQGTDRPYPVRRCGGGLEVADGGEEEFVFFDVGAEIVAIGNE